MKQIHGGDVYTYPGVLDYSANINPLGTPQIVLDAIEDNLKNLVHYPDIQCKKLRESIAKYHQMKKENIICGNGAADLIYRLVWAKKPKKAMVLSPCFAEYEQALKTVSSDIVHYKLNRNTFELTEQILSKLTEDLDMLFLCNPNNPTGKLISKGLLEQILKICEEKQIFMVLDECFLDFNVEEEKYTMLKQAETSDSLFVLRAFTKMYAVPGIRLGYGITANEDLLSEMCLAGPPWNVSVLAQAAGEVAIKQKTFVEKTISVIQEEKKYLYEGLKQLSITYWESAANYILIYSKLPLKEELLKKNILVRDCSNYENLEQGYYRIAVKKRKENEMFLEALSSIMKK